VQDGELYAFMEVFRDLLSVFPKRGMDDDEIGTLSKAYFSALRRFSIPDVRAGAEAWTRRGKFFPKPAEWMEVIPRRRQDAVELVPLAPSEAAEYFDAERRKWEGEPCSCRRCQEAGVTHRLLRYAPETDDEDRDLRGLIGERIVTRGRWLHGEELRRFYDVRDSFTAQLQAFIGRKGMPKAKSEAVG
jgi:hypothetical protein